METALLTIKDDIHLSLARGEPTALVLLDLSAAFDTIDHTILIHCLKSWFGVCSTALKWFVSYLEKRRQSVTIGSTLSEVCKLEFLKVVFWALYCFLCILHPWQRLSANTLV